MATELTLNGLKKLWHEKLERWRTTDTFNLYIDTPFCVQQCEFCIHYGTKTAIGSELYNKYFKEFLPKQIDDFRDILSLRRFDSVYFGGGTPSLMTIDTMKSTMERIPNFEAIPEKSFEAHPAFMTKEKIDLLAQFKFTFVSFGIQTFDEAINKQQNRIYVKPEKIKDLVRYAQEEKGLNINCDLLAFIETGTIDDLKTLNQDLDYLMNDIKPNIITIYPMYQRFAYNFDEGKTEGTREEIQESIALASGLNKLLLKALRHNSDYHSPQEISLDKEEIKEKMVYDKYLLRMSTDEFYGRVKKYSCSSFPFHPEHQNVIGLGGYGRRMPYSYQGHDLYYKTHNKDWNARYIADQMEEQINRIYANC